MDPRPSLFDVAAFEALRGALNARLGTPLTAVHETGSTNDDAMTAASHGTPSGATFVADAQTRGRGRRGSAWSSPPGENLTFSVVLRPSVPVEHAAQLTLVAGAALRAAVAGDLDVPVAIKWPNDLVVERKKLAGILVESKLTGRKLDAVVVGVGANVSMTTLPPDIAATATSLALLGDHRTTRESLLARFLFELERRLDAFELHGLVSCLDEIRAHDALRDRTVCIDGLEGLAAGIERDGALLVRDASGTLHVVTSGHVEW